MKIKSILTSFAAVLIALLMLCGCSEYDFEQVFETSTVSVTSETVTYTSEFTSETSAEEKVGSETVAETAEIYTFRSKELFDSHFEKHGAEFGNITQEEYLALANELINAKGDNILHKTEKEDGDFLYYDTETNEFLVLSTDGYIRTFFKPSAGIDYWERQ